ncbi:N-acetyltransferase [Rouxiella sp. Mn2063]|uniref:N-acetyltransferase n=1 Tax=Rouxiella sp. Mn2063 TaxID=3395262 RepID=UPI003BC05E3A
MSKPKAVTPAGVSHITFPHVIRPVQPADIEPLMLLWLQASIDAHPFIAATYWFESAAMVRDTLVSSANTWVACHQESGKLIGFISLLNSQFVAALFVEKSVYGQGVAQQLMAEVKYHYPSLLLEVYQQNFRAVAFYHKENFSVVKETQHPGTKLPTWVMRWQNAR